MDGFEIETTLLVGGEAAMVKDRSIDVSSFDASWVKRSRVRGRGSGN